jgi:aspartate aminotransferase
VTLLSKRIAAIQGSPTLASARRASELRARGRDVINLGIGELEFDVPANVKQAAIRAIREGHGRSTPVTGIDDLKDAITAKLLRDNDLRYGRDEVIVGTGTKQVIFNAMFATLDEGDEVLVPAPYWVSYPEIVRMSGGTPVVVSTRMENGFKLQPQELADAITPRTKWVILNSPSNPTGAVYTRDELMALAEVLDRHPSVLVLSDDIYERFVYRGIFATIGQCAPSLLGRTLTVNGVSKSHAMIGWRLGYGAGPAPLVAAMANVQSQVTSGTCSVVQVAAVEALDGTQDASRAYVDAFRARRELIVDGLSAIPQMSFVAAEGAFYVYPRCAAYIGLRTPSGGLISTDEDLADYLMTEASVACIGGQAFGVSPHLRLAYVCDDARLSEALSRMRSALARLE